MFAFYLSGLKKIFNFAKKAALVIAVFSIVISLFMRSIGNDKQKTSYDPIKRNRDNIYRIINDPTLNKSKEGRIKLIVYKYMMCGLIGEACTNVPDDGEKNFSKSVFGMMTNLIALPYKNPPASGVMWAYNGLANAGFVPKTYAAQGIGSASINAFAPLWDAFRKLAYMILVIIIIAIGFMIMFRMKLNPQTVISVESALPRIVITLILITFSFAIVGFAIDLMYLVTMIVVEIIGKAVGFTNIAAAQKDIITNDLFANKSIWNWSQFFWTYQHGLYGLIDILPFTIRGIINVALSFAVFLLSMRFIGPFSDWIQKIFGDLKFTGSVFTIAGLEISVGQIIAIVLGLILGFLIGEFFLWLVIAVIVLLGLLFLLFRIFFTLLSSLVQILLYLMFAPLLLLLEAIPGRSAFSGWFKNIIGNLVVFPAVIFLLLITAAVTKIYDYSQVPIMTIPPSTQVFTPPLLGNIDANVIGPLINAVLLLSIPDLVKALKQWIIGKEGIQIPASPGALFGSVGAVGGSVMGLMNQLYYFQMGSQALFGHVDPQTKQRSGGIFSGVVGAITGASKKS